MVIRQETEADYKAVYELIKIAFASEKYSNHQEHLLVSRLRSAKAFVPALSLVAQVHEKVVGHILLTKIALKADHRDHKILALAPVSVLPAYQLQGIGSQLIVTAHQVAQKLGYRLVVLLGHAGYYPRFGYRPAHTFGIKLPFDAPAENCMAKELVKGSLKGIFGTVEYPKEFYH
jgi:predicted N-acetyltransferase YhbS